MNDLLLRHVTVRFGLLTAVDDVTIEIAAGCITSLVGPNGAGKSTLLGAASGAIRPVAGEIRIDDHAVSGGSHHFARVGIRRTFQTPRVMPAATLVDNVMVASAFADRGGLLADLFDTVRRARRERAHRDSAERALDRVGLLERASDPAGSLSYGQVRLLELARALAPAPRFLLLDEPAAGLNDDETDLLGDLLSDLATEEGIGVVLVEHNLRLVTTISRVIHVLNFGQLIASGPPDEIVRNPAVVEAYTGEAL